MILRPYVIEIFLLLRFGPEFKQGLWQFIVEDISELKIATCCEHSAVEGIVILPLGCRIVPTLMKRHVEPQLLGNRLSISRSGPRAFPIIPWNTDGIIN